MRRNPLKRPMATHPIEFEGESPIKTIVIVGIEDYHH